MAEGLPLPYQVQDEAAQGNFDEIKKQFPLSRRNLKLEDPHVVGAAGEPAFQGTWVNWDPTAFQGARFWKDPLDIVHVQGLVKNGVAGTTIFVLPEGYRPAAALIFAEDSNTGHGRLDIYATGNVTHVNGGTGNFSINASFRRGN